MTREECEDQLLVCYHLARVLMSTPLADMANLISRADSIGALTDPTAWMRNRRHMHEDEQVIEILRLAAAGLKKLPWPTTATTNAGGAV